MFEIGVWTVSKHDLRRQQKFHQSIAESQGKAAFVASTPLYDAAEQGNAALLKTLLENGEDVNVVNSMGYTPVHLACYNNHTSCIMDILKYKPNLNVQDRSRSTPLNILVRNCSQDEEVLMMLLNAGANPNISDEDGKYPLHYVAEAKEARCARQVMQATVLIRNNADVNGRDIYGNTPLHYAIMRGFDAIVEILLENGASFDNKNIFKLSQIETAFIFKSQYPDIFERINKHLLFTNSPEMKIKAEDFESEYEVPELTFLKPVCGHHENNEE